MMLLEAKKTGKAEEQLMKAAALDPGNLQYITQLALASFWLANYDRASVWTKKALELRPKDAKLHLQLGDIYRDQVMFKDAEEQYKKAVNLDNSLAEAHCHMGYLLWEEGKFKDAEKFFRKAVELKPELLAQIEERKK
jgi:protein O-GlcNAc transferase